MDARLLLDMLITASIAGCLAGFLKINDFFVWPKRIFNTLAIALTSLLSVEIGSIIGELGKTVRWKILASAPHNLQDVSSSTASFRHHPSNQDRISCMSAKVIYYCE